MDPKLVNASHFFSSELRVPGNTSNPIGFTVTIAQIPGLNTLGLALGRGDYAPEGTSTLHTHPRATEITTVLEGSLIAGFVTSNPENRLVWKVLQKGDVFVFPIGLVHFTFNGGNGPTATIAAFTSQSPGFIRVGDLFATNPSIPDDILAKAFQVDESVIRKLRPWLKRLYSTGFVAVQRYIFGILFFHALFFSDIRP